MREKGVFSLHDPKPRFEILGVKISAINLKEAIEVIDLWIKNKHKDYIVLTGSHGVIEMQEDEKLKSINNFSGLTTPDGMPIVWLGRLNGFKHIEKVYAPDIMLATFKVSITRGYRHFFYGGKKTIPELLAKKMKIRFPGLKIVGTYSPPFRQLTKEEEQSIADMINSTNPDIIWAGLGCPKQEYWMTNFRSLLEAPVLIGVGAGFDFLAGKSALAPNWIKISGFEWLFRLLNDPKRLWARYSRVIPKFIYLCFTREKIFKKFIKYLLKKKDGK